MASDFMKHLAEMKKLLGDQGPFKDLHNFLHTEENLKRCEPFEILNQKYVALYRQYADSYAELTQDLEEKAVRVEYAKGGETLHRGYYSPSVDDLHVGGANRGRLLKRPPKDNSFDYRYLFDAEDKMLSACKYASFGDERVLYQTEVFLYQGDKVLTLSYESKYRELTVITECLYENAKLLRYEYASLTPALKTDSCNQIDVEELSYENGLMRILERYRYRPELHSLDHCRLTFERDADGFLSAYTFEEFDAFVQRPPQKYPVLVKRK